VTTRNDVDVVFTLSPRVAEVRAPSTEIIMQDLVDTMRIEEESFRGMSYDKLLNASGKEDLGGGVKVGITVAMQNLLLAFEGRTTPAETGTVTSVPSSPVAGRQVMQDSTATFITNGVARGSLLINFTDQSVADVVSVDSETQLTTKTLIEGITDSYTVLDDYKVWNIIQVSATGGNLTAVDELQSVIAAILPTAFTQVVLTSSASATLSEQADIQYASFNGGVSVDLLAGTSGTTFPTGTERQPVDNFTDALAIANERGFLTLYVFGDALIAGGLDFTNFTIVGQGQNLSTFTLDPGAVFVNNTFAEAKITGTLDGDTHVDDCTIENLNFVSGVIENCLLNPGTITLGGSDTAHFINCASGVPGPDTPNINMGGSGQALAMRNYNGGIKIINKTGADKVSIDLNSGQIILDSTVAMITADWRIDGIGHLTDNSTGEQTPNRLVSGEQIQIMSKMMRNRMETDPATGILTIYDDDDVTVLLSGNIYEDVLATQIYRGRGAERRDRLT